MILARFRRNPQARTIHALYGTIVAQARSATFYADYGVPDTVEGRFDLIVLHLVLLLHRLGGRGGSRDAAWPSCSDRSLFDAFCRDLDANLREMGVGDLAVPKRMRPSAKPFTAGKPPIWRRLTRRTSGSLRRRWHAISFAAGNDAEPLNWRAMRARR